VHRVDIPATPESVEIRVITAFLLTVVIAALLSDSNDSDPFGGGRRVPWRSCGFGSEHRAPRSRRTPPRVHRPPNTRRARRRSNAARRARDSDTTSATSHVLRNLFSAASRPACPSRHSTSTTDGTFGGQSLLHEVPRSAPLPAASARQGDSHRRNRESTRASPPSCGDLDRRFAEQWPRGAKAAVARWACRPRPPAQSRTCRPSASSLTATHLGAHGVLQQLRSGKLRFLTNL